MSIKILHTAKLHNYFVLHNNIISQFNNLTNKESKLSSDQKNRLKDDILEKDLGEMKKLGDGRK